MEEIKKYTCEYKSCNKEFDEKEFQITQDTNKCILHCEKNNWHEEKETIFGRIKICDEKKYTTFTENFNQKIKVIKMNSLRLEGIHFPYNPLILPDGLSSVIIDGELKEIFMEDCTFYGPQTILLNQHKSYELEKMNFFNIKSEFKISFCKSRIKNLEIINSNIYFLEISFSELENFKVTGHFSENDYRTIKYINLVDLNIKNNCWIYELDLIELRLHSVNFSKTTLEKLNIKSLLQVDKSKFENRLDFFDVEYLGNLNLDKTSIPKNSSFLSLVSKKDRKNTINVSNRETARIIKDSFEQQNNIIEANKFYALEMKERENELSPKKDFFEWLVFKFHGLSSNHSQDWFLSLLWIIIVSFVVGLFNQKYYFEIDKYIFISLILIVPILIGLKFDETKRKIGLSLFIIFFYWNTSINLNFVSNLINPFSIMTGKDELTFGILIYKITIAYLIYQLIISIRQNTRRK